jgi:hypothetical protein
MRLRGRDNYFVPSAVTDGFKCARDVGATRLCQRNLQSVIDNLKTPKTIEQLCEKTVLNLSEVQLCLQQLEEEDSLIFDGDFISIIRE